MLSFFLNSFLKLKSNYTIYPFPFLSPTFPGHTLLALFQIPPSLPLSLIVLVVVGGGMCACLVCVCVCSKICKCNLLSTNNDALRYMIWWLTICYQIINLGAHAWKLFMLSLFYGPLCLHTT